MSGVILAGIGAGIITFVAQHSGMPDLFAYGVPVGSAVLSVGVTIAAMGWWQS